MRASITQRPGPPRNRLQRAVVGLAGADADDALDVGYEDLAGLGRLHDGLDDLIDQVAPHRNLDPRLGYEVDNVLRAAIQLGVSALAPKSLHLGDRHPRHTDVRERGAYVVELEGLDDRCDQFHERTLPLRGLRRVGILQFPCHHVESRKSPAATSWR